MCIDRKDIEGMIRESELRTHDYIEASHVGMAKSVSGFGNDLNELEKDIGALKKWLMTVAGIVCTGLLGYGIWMGNIQTRIATNEADIREAREVAAAMGIAQNSIQVQLARIETILMEIQKQIIKHE